MWRVASKELRGTITGQFPLKDRVNGNKNLKFHIPSVGPSLLKRKIYQ